MKPSVQMVDKMSKGDPEIAGYFHALFGIIDQQAKRIQHLEARVVELERQLGQNSSNSSKPPSSDGLRKPTNSRTPGGKNGAPKGHKGTTLHAVQDPDEITFHVLSSCSDCHHSLASVPNLRFETRQVFDLPAPRVWVTEHRAEIKCCPACGRKQKAAFPEAVEAPVQYGTGFAAWTAYLHAFQMMPLDRIRRLFTDLTGYAPSEATLLASLQDMHHKLEAPEAQIRAQLLGQPVVHADETGFRADGRTQWMHVASDETWTLLGVHSGRGREGMEALGFLPAYSGTVVHDCLASYFKADYAFEHALCNAHLLRECQGIVDYDGHVWAAEMKELLQESWKLARAARMEGTSLQPEVIQAVSEWYDTILERGAAEWTSKAAKQPKATGGKRKKSKAENLAIRFRLYKDTILRFIHDARIPFDNNQAERDLRMVKVKQKVSGAFRTVTGAERFARLRGFISTCLKQNIPVLASLTDATRGQFLFQTT